MTPEEATEMLKMLAPRGGLPPEEPPPLERARLVRRLYDYIRKEGGYMPDWLREEARNPTA